MAMSEASSIALVPTAICESARSARAPPACMFARNRDMRGASGVRSKVKFRIFAGVFTKGRITFVNGNRVRIFMSARAKSPGALWKV
jgi:hypothetical protein